MQLGSKREPWWMDESQIEEMRTVKEGSWIDELLVALAGGIWKLLD